MEKKPHIDLPAAETESNMTETSAGTNLNADAEQHNANVSDDIQAVFRFIDKKSIELCASKIYNSNGDLRTCF